MTLFCPKCKQSIPSATPKAELEGARDIGYADGTREAHSSTRTTVERWRDEEAKLNAAENSPTSGVAFCGAAYREEAYQRVIDLLPDNPEPKP